MYAQKITDSEISANRIASLPTRPTASTAFGGKGYSAAEMKEAFDKLPLILIDRFNKLIDDIRRFDDEALTGDIPTGIDSGHNLKQMFSDIKGGEFAGYLKVGDESLATAIANLYNEIENIKSAFGYLNNY